MEKGRGGGGDNAKGSSGDSSSSMEDAVIPTEDVVQALLDYLVDPLLPGLAPGPVRGSSVKERSPSLSEQESMAKQMYAVVLLYNYYHRKQFQHLEFLDFESFCKVAVNAKPQLLVYMELMQRCSSESNEPEKLLSVTEKAMMDACNTCLGLDASRDTPCMKEWPISKVVVFLIDKPKKNCLLLFGSIAQGVWSPLEKDIDNSNDKPDNRSKVRKTDKNKSATEVNFEQLAFSAVKEKTGIDQTDLMILGSHVFPSLSTEKTAARFYLMCCTKTVNKGVIPIPIEDTINSLQGPLVKSLGPLGNVTSAVVENFHLLPYAGILSDWLSRTGQESSPTMDHSDTVDDESSDRPYGTCQTADFLEKKTSNTTAVNREDILDCLTRGGSDDDSSVAHRSSKEKSMPTQKKVSGNPVDRKRKSSIKGDPSITKNDRQYKVEKVEKVDLVIEPCNNGRTGAKAAYGNDNGNIRLQVQEEIPSADHPVLSQSHSESPDNVHAILSSKGNALLNAAVRALHKKRDELSQQQRYLQDEIALCEQNLQKILSGGDDLMLKLECIIEACNIECYTRSIRSHVDPHQNSEERSTPHMKMNKLSEAILSLRNPCQDLDEICCKNNWALPRYNVLPSNGGFHAKLTLKGMDFEFSVGGEPHADPREARESAAANMLTKLRSTASQSKTN